MSRDLVFAGSLLDGYREGSKNEVDTDVPLLKSIVYRAFSLLGQWFISLLTG